MTTLRIDDIRRDGGTQPREKLDHSVIADYADDMERGDTFPPVKVMNDGENYWLYDGFHRVNAAEEIGREEVEAKVKQGTREDAVWASLSANKKHGKRRSQADKRRAIKRALKMKGADKPNTHIARHVGCDDKTVAKYRREMESSSEIPKREERTVTRDGTTYTQDTSNIGGHPSESDSKDTTQKSLPTKPSGDGSPSKPSRSTPSTPSPSPGSSATKPTRTKPDRSTDTDDADPDLSPPEPEPDEPPTAEDIVKEVCQHIAEIDISTGAIDAAKFMEDLDKFTDDQRERVSAQLRSTADRLATRANKIDPS